jgi:hypothetical protein
MTSIDISLAKAAERDETARSPMSAEDELVPL